METIIAISVTVLILSFIITMITPISLDLYFMTLNIERHPVLKAMVDDVLTNICKEEDITVLHKTYEEINVNIEDDREKALGMYVYTLDEDHRIKLKQTYLEVKDLEHKHGIPYKEICKLQGIETTHSAEDFALPKILLCKEKLMKFGLNSYYSTYFHEIGHHFAIKNMGKHTEEDANKFGHKIIVERLPLFFQLFPDFSFRYRDGVQEELKNKEKRIAMLGYLKYYIKNWKTIKRKK
jgi:hypothetical protein